MSEPLLEMLAISPKNSELSFIYIRSQTKISMLPSICQIGKKHKGIVRIQI